MSSWKKGLFHYFCSRDVFLWFCGGLRVRFCLCSVRVVCVELETPWPVCQLPAAETASRPLIGIFGEDSHLPTQKLS